MCGVGNLLVEELPFDAETVEAILNGTWKPEYWAQQFLPGLQLIDERAKRRHRREYHARLHQRLSDRAP